MLAGIVSASPALQVREREILSRYADRLRDELADELGSQPGDLRPAIVAGAILALHQAVIAGYRQGLLDKEPAAQLQRRMLTSAGDAFDMVTNAFIDLGQRRGST
jgi:hypothetical protein